MSQQILKVAIVHENAEARNALHWAILQLGHAVCLHARSGKEFVEQSGGLRPDLVIVQETLPDMPGTQAVQAIAGEALVPVIVVIERPNGHLLDLPSASNVMAVLHEPIQPPDLLPVIPLAMQYFQRLQSLRDAVALLKEALGDDRPG